MSHGLKRMVLRDRGRRPEKRSEMTPERRRNAHERMLAIAEENEQARSAPAPKARSGSRFG